MKRISKRDLVDGESYLVMASLNWSQSGFDVCNYDNGELISQSNREDVIDICLEIYTLPDL